MPAIRSLYLHVPFCFHKCHYCDFYSIVDTQDRQQAFTTRLVAEIDAVHAELASPIRTIFVGGGTPTLLREDLWRSLLREMNARLRRDPDCEWTVEANPETVTPELMVALAEGGVNRISIGAQSFNPRHLKTLERWHDPKNVHRSVEIIRAAGIDNLNLDLIFSIPGQSLNEWLADLDEALSLRPAHLSCYSLMYESNTPLTKKMKAGLIQPLDQDLEAEMYEATIDRLAAAGFEQYEISNWARASASPMGDGSVTSKVPAGDWRCRHNLAYWQNDNWWAFGPSASGHVDGVRWKNVPRLGDYLDHSPHTAITDYERLDLDGRIGEQLMLRLRLIEGLGLEAVDALLSQGCRGADRRGAIDRRLAEGLLEQRDRHLRLTRRGLLLADSVLADLI